MKLDLRNAKNVYYTEGESMPPSLFYSLIRSFLYTFLFIQNGDPNHKKRKCFSQVDLINDNQL